MKKKAFQMIENVSKSLLPSMLEILYYLVFWGFFITEDSKFLNAFQNAF